MQEQNPYYEQLKEIMLTELRKSSLAPDSESPLQQLPTSELVHKIKTANPFVASEYVAELVRRSQIKRLARVASLSSTATAPDEPASDSEAMPESKVQSWLDELRSQIEDSEDAQQP